MPKPATSTPVRCKLCHEVKPLKASHITPAFVFRWMRRTSGGSRLRVSANPNVAYQDGNKTKLLCGECEAILARDEDAFKRQIFDPVVSGCPPPLAYDGFLMRFAISLLWRHLVTSSCPDPEIGLYQDLLDEAQEEWRSFLFRQGELRKFGRVHMLCTGITPGFPDNVYLTRAVDGTIVCSQKRCGVYVKFARFIILAEITDNFSRSEWVNTEIHNGSGILNGACQVNDQGFHDFLLDRPSILKDVMDAGTSPRQQDKILDWAKQNAEAVANSELFETMSLDSMFAHARDESFPKVGRNELCLCGSGKKYKKCHGISQ